MTDRIIKTLAALCLVAILGAPAHAVYSKGGVSSHGHGSISDGGSSITPLSLTQSSVSTFSTLGRVVIGSNTVTRDGLTISTQTVFTQLATPSGVVGAGVIYYSTNNVFMVRENNGVEKPIVDPPGNWTCTRRTGAGGTGAAAQLTDTVTCSGNEKVISGGCTWSGMSFGGSGQNQAQAGGPTNQGWTCIGWNNGASLTLTAYANCCL